MPGSWNLPVAKGGPSLRARFELHKFTLAWSIIWSRQACQTECLQSLRFFQLRWICQAVCACVTVNDALLLQWWKLLSDQITRSQAKVKQTMRGNRTNWRNICENLTKSTVEQESFYLPLILDRFSLYPTRMMSCEKVLCIIQNRRIQKIYFI